MMEGTLTLQQACDWLSSGRSFRISIHDLTGILHAEGLLRMRTESMFHQSPVCVLAKTAMNRLPLCLRCKRAAVARAIASPEPFFGTCHMGVYEWVVPVWQDGRPICIVFLGNLHMPEEAAKPASRGDLAPTEADRRRSPSGFRMLRRASYLGVSTEQLSAAIDACELIDPVTASHYRVPAEMLALLIRTLVSDARTRSLFSPESLRITGYEPDDTTRNEKDESDGSTPVTPPPPMPSAFPITKKAPPASPSWRGTRHPVILSVLDHVDMDYARPLSLHSLAKLHFVDTAYLCRLFRKETGTTFTSHLNRVRLSVAKGLLVSTDWPVQEVARTAGYTHPNYFSRLFLADTGLTPAVWRSMRREEGSV